MQEYRRNQHNEKSLLLGMVIGAAAGVVATLLLAPEEGKKTRETLKKNLKKAGKSLEGIQEKFAEEGSEWRQNFSTIANKIVEEVQNEAKKDLNIAAKSVKQATEAVVEMTEEPKDENESKAKSNKPAANAKQETKSDKPRFFRGT